MTRPRARLIAFFALVSFGALQWIRLLDPAPVGRTIWFLLAAVVAGLGLRWCNRLERRARWGATAGISFLLVIVGLLLAGIPFSLVEPRGWGDLVSGLSQGIETLPSMRIPYRGAEPWAHDTLVFIGYLLVALATVLACLPRGDARPGVPLAAAVVVGVLVGVPSVSLESSSPVLVGLVFTALLVAYLRVDRDPARRDGVGGRDRRGRPARGPRAGAARRRGPPAHRLRGDRALGVQDGRRELQLVAQLRPAELAARPAASCCASRPIARRTGRRRTSSSSTASAGPPAATAGCRASTPPRCPTSATRGASGSSSRSAACARRRSSARGRRCRWRTRPGPCANPAPGASRPSATRSPPARPTRPRCTCRHRTAVPWRSRRRSIRPPARRT